MGRSDERAVAARSKIPVMRAPRALANDSTPTPVSCRPYSRSPLGARHASATGRVREADVRVGMVLTVLRVGTRLLGGGDVRCGGGEGRVIRTRLQEIK